MRRALLLTYYVPPQTAVASVRVGNMMNALREHGWEIVPFSPQTTGTIDFKAPARRLLGVRSGSTTHERFGVVEESVLARPSLPQRAIMLGHRVTSYANGRFGWFTTGVRAVRNILRSGKFDAVISTSPPEATHLVASLTHGDIPWIADLRDPWVRHDTLNSLAALRAVDRVIEPLVLRTASALTTVSEPLADTLRKAHPHAFVQAIPNAFSARDWEDIPFERPARVTFFHAGQLYRGRCNPQPLFEALSHLLAEGLIAHEEVEVDLYGDEEPWVADMIRRYALGRVVHLRGRLPRDRIMRLERAASRLIIFVRDGPDERGTYTGKLFEYFGARRPIVAVGGPAERTVMDDALAQSGAGKRHQTARSLRDEILEAVTEWRSGVTATVSERAVEPFELRHFGERFMSVLERVHERAVR